jgi:hypothetical protein
MYASPVVFCERTGNWAAAWRRLRARLGQTSPRLIETRSAAECREVVAANRGSFVVVELEPARAEQALDLLFELGIGFAGAVTAVVASRPMWSHEWLARELGAQTFIASLFDLDRLYTLAERHAARRMIGPNRHSAADERERTWNNLPWGRT